MEGVNEMEYNEQNWKELLEALHFTECNNEAFGGMVICDDNGIPVWDYDNDERKKNLFMFLSGALYMKQHLGFY